MRRGQPHANRAQRRGFTALGVRLSLLAVLISLAAQTVAFGAHGARAADDPRLAEQALSRMLGSPVVLCVQGEDDSPAGPACHDACPLCQLADHSASFAMPFAPAVLAPAPPRGLNRPAVAADAPLSTKPIGLPFAQGPPRSL